MSLAPCVGALAADTFANTAPADQSGAEAVNLMSASPAIPVAAVHAPFAVAPGKAVRLAVYDSAEAFLETARVKLQAIVSEEGVAILPLAGLEPGNYAFVAYLDEDGDGKLKRGKLLGRPKEPLAFSNGAKAKLRKPRFDEASVTVAPGSVVEITLDD